VIIKNYNISASISNITYKFADILSYINNTKEFLQQISISASIISYTNLSLTINLDTYIDPLIFNYMMINTKLFYQIKFNEFNNLVYNSNKHIYEVNVEGYKFSMSINDNIIICNNILFSNSVYILKFVNRILRLYIRTYQANKFNFKDNNIIELNGFNGYKTIDLLYYSRYFTNYDNILPEEISVNDLSHNTYVVYNNRYYRAPLNSGYKVILVQFDNDLIPKCIKVHSSIKYKKNNIYKNITTVMSQASLGILLNTVALQLNIDISSIFRFGIEGTNIIN